MLADAGDHAVRWGTCGRSSSIARRGGAGGEDEGAVLVEGLPGSTRSSMFSRAVRWPVLRAALLDGSGREASRVTAWRSRTSARSGRMWSRSTSTRSSSPRSADLGLFDEDERVALEDGCRPGRRRSADDAAAIGGDDVLHLHGFHDDELAGPRGRCRPRRRSTLTIVPCIGGEDGDGAVWGGRPRRRPGRAGGGGGAGRVAAGAAIALAVGRGRRGGCASSIRAPAGVGQRAAIGRRGGHPRGGGFEEGAGAGRLLVRGDEVAMWSSTKRVYHAAGGEVGVAGGGSGGRGCWSRRLLLGIRRGRGAVRVTRLGSRATGSGR